MRPGLTYDSLHNPFQNRFNVQVTCRRDEMQSPAYQHWLRDRNQIHYTNTTSECAQQHDQAALEPRNPSKLFATILTFISLVLLLAALLRVF